MQFGFDEVGRGCLAGPVTTCAVVLGEKLPKFTFNYLQKSVQNLELSGKNLFSEVENFSNLNDISLYEQIDPVFQKIYDSKKVKKLEREKINLFLNNLDLPIFDFLILNCPAKIIDKYGISQCVASMLLISVFHFSQAKNFYCDGGINIKQAFDNNVIKEILEFNLREKINEKKENAIKNLLKNREKIISQALQKNLNFENKSDEKYLSVASASILAKSFRDDFMINISEKFPKYHFHTNVGYGSKKHIEVIQKHGICKFHRKSWLGKILPDN